MTPGYEPQTLTGKLLWLAEEASEVSKEILKTLRIAELKQMPIEQALFLYNPDRLREGNNRQRILSEMEDLISAFQHLITESIMKRTRCVSGSIDCFCMATEIWTCSGCKKLTCYCHGVYDAGSLTSDLCSDCHAKAHLHAKTKKVRKAKTQSGKAAKASSHDRQSYKKRLARGKSRPARVKRR